MEQRLQSQANSEIEDESRMNALMRRLEKVQREKGKIIVELEREEEMVSQSSSQLCGMSICLMESSMSICLMESSLL